MDRFPATPVIVFGAFDRHNFGDLLFPHIVSALLPGQPLIFAGLVERDLRQWGGHRVRALPTVLRSWQGPAPIVLHAGGELLTCNAWEAAIMLQPHVFAQTVIDRLHGQADRQDAWAANYLHIGDGAPYLANAAYFPQGTRILYNAVGGVDLDIKSEKFLDEVTAKLHGADFVGVRDKISLSHLQQAGVPALLMPDPAALTRRVCGLQIAGRATQGDVASVRAVFPQGYVAVQCSADFGDDATLDILEDQLRRISLETGLGIVLFRAGLAPWHDEQEVYERLAIHFSRDDVRVFQSAYLWDICALIASSRAYCGSSLHGRIVAMSYGLPRVNLVQADLLAGAGKQAAYAASWDRSDLVAVAPPAILHSALMQALAFSDETRQSIAENCANRYGKCFIQLCEAAGIGQMPE